MQQTSERDAIGMFGSFVLRGVNESWPRAVETLRDAGAPAFDHEAEPEFEYMLAVFTFQLLTFEDYFEEKQAARLRDLATYWLWDLWGSDRRKPPPFVTEEDYTTGPITTLIATAQRAPQIDEALDIYELSTRDGTSLPTPLMIRWFGMDPLRIWTSSNEEQYNRLFATVQTILADAMRPWWKVIVESYTLVPHELNSETASRFSDLLTTPTRVPEVPRWELADFLFFSVQTYGSTNDSNLIGPLRVLYHRCNAELSVNVRESVQDAISAAVADNDLSSNALLPFVSTESARHIVSKAVLEFLMYRPSQPDDLLAGVRDILALYHAETTVNAGAVLGGLLLTGDRRVIDAVMGVVDKDTSLTTIKELAKTHSGFLYAPVIECYLGWLESLNNEATEAEFGVMASGLTNMLRRDQTGEVLELRRDFGQGTEASSVEVIAQYLFDDYAPRVLAKMAAIAEAESEPKLMPRVGVEWRQHRLPERTESVVH